MQIQNQQVLECGYIDPSDPGNCIPAKRHPIPCHASSGDVALHAGVQYWYAPCVPKAARVVQLVDEPVEGKVDGGQACPPHAQAPHANRHPTEPVTLHTSAPI